MADTWPEADLGELVSEGVVLSYVAGGSIAKGDIVKLSDAITLEVVKGDADCKPAGVALKTVESGEQVPVCVHGPVKVNIGAAVTAGVAVKCDANAKCITLVVGTDDASLSVGKTLQSHTEAGEGLVLVNI